jgi:hypothetical protein
MEIEPELLLDVLKDAVVDTLPLVPLLFVTYLAMEALEHAGGGRLGKLIARAGAWGPVAGAVLGAVPQCGFSAMVATFFSARVVTLGTLVACFLATSDEMLPVFIANQAPAGQIVTLLAIKVLVGMVAGLLVDAFIRVWRGPVHYRVCDACAAHEAHAAMAPQGDAEKCCGAAPAKKCGEAAVCCENGSATSGDAPAATPERGVSGQDVAEGEAAAAEALAASDDVCGCGCSCGHTHGHGDGAHEHAHGSIWKEALYHTLLVTVFVFLVTLVLGLVFELIGHEAMHAFFSGNVLLATLAAGLLGLVPNCAASVVISELFLEGALATGPLVAGLLVSCGVGTLVLLRTNKPLRQNVAILALVWAIGVGVGLIVAASGFTL